MCVCVCVCECVEKRNVWKIYISVVLMICLLFVLFIFMPTLFDFKILECKNIQLKLLIFNEGDDSFSDKFLKKVRVVAYIYIYI